MLSDQERSMEKGVTSAAGWSFTAQGATLGVRVVPSTSLESLDIGGKPLSHTRSLK